jgi:hypothetical protein
MLERCVQFCPFCGEDLGKESVREEYDEAFSKAVDNDSTAFDNEAALEAFRIEFLTSLEAEEEAAPLLNPEEGSQEQQE